ncbi:CobW family GTP-binding protein [Emticicia fontis]
MKIPVNLITGFLGVGKTTAIKHLLASKPQTERWAIIINEFGAVSIDHTAIEEKDGLTIREVAGGCICCTANVPMQYTLTTVLRQQKPDRILIEPTGMGHPENILDLLRGKFMKDILDVRATICLVDPRRWANADVRANETFQDQINLADVLIANKTDLAGEELTEEFKDWADSLYPPKLLIADVSNGEVDFNWLNIEPFGDRKAQFAHEVHHHHPAHEEELPVPTVGNPVKKESHGLGLHGCGWIFSPDEIFNLPKLRQFFSTLNEVYRAKGVFRTGKDWVLINAVGEEFTVQYITYRRDSRIELIAPAKLDWASYEEKLNACLLEVPVS